MWCALPRGILNTCSHRVEAVFQGFLRFVRVTHLCVELGDVGGNLLLGFRFRLAGEHLATLDALLIKVPDDTLPSSIRAPKYIAVCCESFLWHGWWFLPSGVLFNHQHYSRGLAYVHPYVPNRTEKNLPAFWWFYTCLGRGVFSRPFSLFIAAQLIPSGKQAPQLGSALQETLQLCCLMNR